MFYKGLRQDPKDIIGHLYHSITDFDELRVEIRKIETEHPVQSRSKPKPATVKSDIYLRLIQQVLLILSLKIFRLRLIR